jgi:hypothetical protein
MVVLGVLLVAGGLLANALADPNLPTSGPESRTASRPEWLEVGLVIALTLLAAGGLPIAYVGTALAATGVLLMLWGSRAARRT